MKPSKTAKKSRPSKITVEVVEATEIIPAYELADVGDPAEMEFIKLYVSHTMTTVAAAQKVWPHLKYGSAANQAQRVLNKNRGYLTAAMDEAGITLEILLGVVSDGLSAKRPAGMDGHMVTDHPTRHRFVETALKLRGDLVVKPPEIIFAPSTTINNTNNVLQISAKKEMLDGFLSYMERSTSEQLIKNAHSKEIVNA